MEIHSYANSINTSDGGTHEMAVRAGLTRAVRAYAERKNLIPKNIKTIASEDVYEGLYGIVSVLIKNPQFQGQTKEKLNNPEISSPIEHRLRRPARHAPGEPDDGRRRGQARAAGGRGADGVARGQGQRDAKAVVAQAEPAGQARGLLIEPRGGHGAIHRGRRVRRRVCQNGEGPQDPGNPLTSGKDPERGAGGITRKDPDEQRDQEPARHVRMRCWPAFRPQHLV
jgi:hypothetical protein